LIKAGSTLLVPRGGRVETDVSIAHADHGQISLSSEITTRRTMVKAGKHDSVASLAKRYRVAASDLAGWNKLPESAAFKPGQKVVLYLPSSSKSAGKSGGKSRRAGRGETAAGASEKASSKGGTSTRGQGKSAKLKKR
jgi:membrane-bound lytic murein transglycosylase D